MSSGMSDKFYENVERDLREEGVDLSPKLKPESEPGLQIDLQAISSALIELVIKKNNIYRDSYCKKGEIRGICANIDRKYDRLDSIINSQIEGKLDSEGVESKTTTVADLAAYSLLYLQWLMRNKPEEFKSWSKELEEWGIELHSVREADN